MSSDEKYQSGEAYREDRPPPKTPGNFFSDPAKVAADILKDYVGARSEASLQEIIGLVKSLQNEGEPADDRKGNTEVLIGILTGLPSGSATRTRLTNKLIDTLWDNLQHPPLSYVGGDVKYDVAGKAEEAEKKAAQYDIIEFNEPTTGVQLREQVPVPPQGMHHYRMPDGSFNNVLHPNLGKAGSPYAKSVRSVKRLHAVKPDPGLLFDLLMSRDEETFKENPAGISSMLFYHASIIIHDVFRTSRTDMNKSDTSSYLDLAPLYGSSLRDQLKVRTMQAGKLKPDTFHEKRLLGQPAGVNVMLVLYSRFHNYVADILLKINENGRFTLACPPDAKPEDKAKALAKQDHDLFNTARLIVCGLYANISLHDYLRAITNTHHSKSDWTLDPRVEIGKHYDGEGVPRGVGNQVSVEFNLLYRFHSCISKKDEWWINNFFLKLFPGRNPDDLANVSLQELGQALVQFEQKLPEDPSKRTFDDLERGPDGRFKDADLARVLKEAMDDPAGSFGARMVPKALKIVEILGINQARKWNVASLNEFREFFGLRRYEKFSEINPDPTISAVLEKLYTDPDMVELYPGLMIEETKKPRNPGSGICPTYTVGRAVLADAVTLVRSDRFLTIDFTVSTLTAWGLNEIKQDTKTLGGSMLYRLIQRGLPGWFPYNSIAVMQPMYTKKANEAIAKEHGVFDQYTLDDPKPPPKMIKLSTKDAIQKVLTNPKQYPLGWAKPLNSLFPGKRDFSWFMLAGDEPRNYDHRAKMTKAMGKIPNLHKAVHDFIARRGAELIEKESFQLKEGLHQIDILRDVAIPLNTQMMADLFYFDLRTDENPDGKLRSTELYTHLLNVRLWGTSNSDPAEGWNRRRRAQEGCKLITDTTRTLVDEVVASKGLGLGFVSALSNVFTRKAYLKKDSLRSSGLKLVEELLAQGATPENVVDQLWLMAFGGVGVLVTTFYEVMEYFLRPANASIWAEVQTLAQKDDEKQLHAYVKEAQRLTNPFKTLRYATKADKHEGQSIEPGNVVVLMLGEAGRTPIQGFEDADKFVPGRAEVSVDGFSHGPHECFGQHLALTFVTGLVKLVADLKKLRPAPGQMGEVKTIQVGFEKVYLNDSWSHLDFNASTWKVHFDGHGKGSFDGEEEQQKPLDMQQYYYSIRKRKAELMG